MMIQVLFVCLGNICRSPMAEAVFRNLVAEAGLSDKIQVDSVGTSGWHEGSPPHEGTMNILTEKKISSTGISSRKLIKEDLKTSHYILAMDEDNLNHLKALIKKEKLALQGKVLKLTDLLKDEKIAFVPDPYYTGDFNYTFELVEAGCKKLLEEIKNIC